MRGAAADTNLIICRKKKNHIYICVCEILFDFYLDLLIYSAEGSEYESRGIPPPPSTTPSSEFNVGYRGRGGNYIAAGPVICAHRTRINNIYIYIYISYALCMLLLLSVVVVVVVKEVCSRANGSVHFRGCKIRPLTQSARNRIHYTVSCVGARAVRCRRGVLNYH